MAGCSAMKIDIVIMGDFNFPHTDWDIFTGLDQTILLFITMLGCEVHIKFDQCQF